MPEFTKPSVVELSVLRDVTGCLWSNEIKGVRIMIAIFLMLKVPHVSSYSTEDMILRMVLHYAWIGPFPLVVGFIGLGDFQYLI